MTVLLTSEHSTRGIWCESRVPQPILVDFREHGRVDIGDETYHHVTRVLVNTHQPPRGSA